MISKKKLRERLLDICNGAGYVWQDDCYFEAERGSSLTAVGNTIQGIERAFDLSDSTRVRTPCRLDAFDSIDTLVELVYEALEYDR